MGKKVIYVSGYNKVLNGVDLTQNTEYEVLQDDGDKYLIKDNCGYEAFLSANAFKDTPIKVKRITISLASGNVLEEKVFELNEFTREQVAEFGEKFDGFYKDKELLEQVLERNAGTHRSVCVVSPTLIVRYMDKNPQYYIKL